MSDPYRRSSPGPILASPNGANDPGFGGRSAGFEVGDGVAREVRRTVLAYPTGDPSTSTLLVERAAPVDVRSGGEVSFRMRLTNLTDLALEDVVLTEVTDANFGFARSDPPADSVEGTTIIWKLGRLEARSQRFVEFSGTAERGPLLNHVASVTCLPLLRSTVRVESPELRLHLTGPAEVGPCETLPLRVTVTNSGRASTNSVGVRIPLPEGITTRSGQRTLDLPFEPLQVGESRVARVELYAEAPGTYPLRANALTELGRATSNVLTPIVRMADLAAQIESEGSVYVGAPLRFRINVQNNGDGALRGSRVELLPPEGTELLSASSGARIGDDGELIWDLERLHAAQSTVLDVAFVTAAPGTARCEVRLVPPCGPPVVVNESVEVLASPDLQLIVTDALDPALVGDAVPYSIRVVNRGTAPLADLALSVRLGADCELLDVAGATDPLREIAGAQGERAIGEGAEVRFALLGTLAPDQEARWRVVVRSRSASRQTLHARVDSNQMALPIERRETTDFGDPLPEPEPAAVPDPVSAIPLLPGSEHQPDR